MSDSLWSIISWILIVVLVGFSGLFSGLNLGLMGLDLNNLLIFKESDNWSHKVCATKIEPLRRTGNWLLCTLLLGNVVVNSGLTILLAEKSSGLIGLALSTFLITLFGEILPQALCSRYALQIGAKTIWIVKILMGLMAIIAYPISICLDWILGEEITEPYTNKELQKFVDIQAQSKYSEIDGSTSKMVKSVLRSKNEIVNKYMTKWDDVEWLNSNDKLTVNILEKISKNGYSRIPVFDDNMIYKGLLYAKDLILFDLNQSNDTMTVKQIINKIKHKPQLILSTNDTLQNALKKFVETKNHLAFVRDDIKNDETNKKIQILDETKEEEMESLCIDKEGKSDKYIGIITLEDVTEHILDEEFEDEYDDTDFNEFNVNQMRSLQSEASISPNIEQDNDVFDDDDDDETILLNKKIK